MTRKHETYLTLSSLASRPRPLLREHSLVRLVRDAAVDDVGTLPAGSTGAVVGVWANGEAYEVEFVEPFHAIVTIAAPGLSEMTVTG